jgi:DNA-binding NarL/FixJ family response regulator
VGLHQKELVRTRIGAIARGAQRPSLQSRAIPARRTVDFGPLIAYSYDSNALNYGSQKLKALVVDDFEAFRLFVCSALQQMSGFLVIDEASDGLEAVEKAEKLQPDLVVLDIGLPKLNGIEVAKRLRQLAPRASILFLSQEPSSDVIQEALRLGALGYVHKSRAGSELLPAIEAVLGGKRYVSRGLNGIEFDEGANVQTPRHHEILFSTDDELVLDRFTDFVARALRTGNPAMVFATEPHRQALLQRLEKQGVEMDAAIQRGTYISLDVAEPVDSARLFQTVRGLIEAASKAGKAGRPRLALCGERAGRLWAEGKTDQAIQLEQLCDNLATTHDVDVLCAYPLDSAVEQYEQSFNSICESHSTVSYR